MTTASRSLSNSVSGHALTEDELCEAIWLVNRELQAGLPKRERVEAKRQIAQYEAMLSALRSAGT